MSAAIQAKDDADEDVGGCVKKLKGVEHFNSWLLSNGSTVLQRLQQKLVSLVCDTTTCCEVAAKKGNVKGVVTEGQVEQSCP